MRGQCSPRLPRLLTGRLRLSLHKAHCLQREDRRSATASSKIVNSRSSRYSEVEDPRMLSLHLYRGASSDLLRSVDARNRNVHVEVIRSTWNCTLSPRVYDTRARIDSMTCLNMTNLNGWFASRTLPVPRHYREEAQVLDRPGMNVSANQKLTSWTLNISTCDPIDCFTRYGYRMRFESSQEAH